MSESIELLYQNSLLADAAYLNWEREEGENDEQFKARLRDLLTKSTDPDDNHRAFTFEQAQIFVNRYTVIRQFNDESTGFAATLFFDEETGKQVLAIRGTEFSTEDYATDILVGLLGVATDQFNSLKHFIAELQSDPAITLDNLTVTGHSLGGHLATLLTLDEALGGLVEQAYTYNGAGLSVVPVPVLGTLVLPALIDFFGLDTGNAATNKITNLFSTAGIEIVSAFGQTFGVTWSNGLVQPS